MGYIKRGYAREFLQGYASCALWSSCGPDGVEHLDDVADLDDISPECWATMRRDCVDFIRGNREDLAAHAAAGWSADHAGHDFWLTRNGHGTGFWDRGLGAVGDRLSAAAKVYGGCDLYLGDDGRVYC